MLNHGSRAASVGYRALTIGGAMSETKTVMRAVFAEDCFAKRDDDASDRRDARAAPKG
jgi:hypothetical protein